MSDHEHKWEMGSDTCTVPGCEVTQDEEQFGAIEGPVATRDVTVLDDDDRTAVLFYLLIRDEVVMGAFEGLLEQAEGTMAGDTVSNPHLIEYARSAVRRLHEA